MEIKFHTIGLFKIHMLFIYYGPMCKHSSLYLVWGACVRSQYYLSGHAPGRLQVGANEGAVSGASELVPVRPVAALVADLELAPGQMYQLL